MRTLVLGLLACVLWGLTGCTGEEQGAPQEPDSPASGQQDEGVPDLITSEPRTLPVVYGDPNVVVTYREESVNLTGSGNPATEGSELAVVGMLDFALPSGLVFALPAAALEDDPKVTVVELEPEELAGELHAGESNWKLSIPGLFEASAMVEPQEEQGQTDVLAAMSVELDQPTPYEGPGFSLHVPAEALPTTALPSSALPAVALPAEALPSSALPSSALPSAALPASALPVVVLPAAALPAAALPAAWYLRAEGDRMVVSALLLHRAQDGGKRTVTCKPSGELAEASTKGLTFECPMRGTLPAGKAQFLVFTTSEAEYYRATLDDEPLVFLPQEFHGGANQAPRILLADGYQLEAGTSNQYLSIDVSDDSSLLLAEVTGLPAYAMRDYHLLTFAPPAEADGTTFSFTVTVRDNGNPRLNTQKSITMRVGTQRLADTQLPSSPALTFNNGATGTALTQPVTVSASDAVGITGFCLEETSTTPTATATCWKAVPTQPSFNLATTYTFTDYGSKILWAFFRDAAGNMSAGASEAITLTRANPFIVIPGGTFQMGQDGEATPVHQVTLTAYKMQQYEVTAGEYKACVDAGGCTYNGETSGIYYTYNRTGYEDHPINYVNWSEARTYCQLLGGDLPTEAQWEYAARGSDGLIYPWGNDAPSSTNTDRANCGESYCYDGNQYTSSVGSYPTGVSPFGLHDMAGNVWEWVADWSGSYPSIGQVDPTGPESGDDKMFRGGSFIDPLNRVLAAKRNNGDPECTSLECYDLGFRCAAPE